ncbi:MAG TPA: hypothetical protein VMN39_04885, partial [Longimicrobiaceae bacterium]|nr:hypothetical protein [Longimicrobiaceae bacterium]
KEALALDSLLAPAAMRGAQAASWEHRPAEGRELLGLALRSPHVLSPGERHLARGLVAHLRGDAPTALDEFHAAVRRDPEWAEAWNAIGEVHRHIVPPEGANDTAAIRAFETALALDPGFRPPRIHLSEYAIRARDFRKAAMHLTAIRQRYSDTVSLRSREIALDCLRYGSSPARWRQAQASPGAILQAGATLAWAGLEPACAEDAFRTVLQRSDAAVGEAWGALTGLPAVLIARGRSPAAVALLDSARAAGNGSVPFLDLFAAAAGAPVVRQAAEADALVRGHGAPYERVAPVTGWAVGIWHASRNDLASLRVLVGRIGEAAARLETGGRTDDAARARFLAGALQAHVIALEGQTGDAIAALREVLATPRPPESWDLATPRALERLRLTSLLLEEGRPAQALAVAETFDHPQPIAFVAFLPHSLALRHRAAEALGDHRLAREFRRRLEALGRLDVLESGSDFTSMEG